MTKRLLALVILTCVFWASACSAQDNENARQAATSIVNDVSANAGPAFEDAKQKLKEGSRDAREAAVRNAVALAGPSEFRRRNVEVSSPMQCSASSPNPGEFTVECTGTTKDGKKAQITGSDPGAADATFVGGVDGTEVFRQNCLGIC
jgi:hypothetical protein